MPYTKLRYHYVFATKNRRRLITPEVEAVLHPAIRETASRSGGHALEVNGIKDHTHLYAAHKPSVSCSDFICRIKCNTSRIIRERFPHLKFAWQKGFGCFTVSPFEDGALVEYIRNQKEHHANGTIDLDLERYWEPPG